MARAVDLHDASSTRAKGSGPVRKCNWSIV